MDDFFEKNNISFLDLLNLFRRRLRLFLAITFAVFVVFAVFVLQLDKKFSATSKILIENQSNNIIDFGQIINGIGSENALIDTQVEILKSSSLAKRVVDNLNLYEQPEINQKLKKKSLISNLILPIKNTLAFISAGLVTNSHSISLSEDDLKELELETIIKNLRQKIFVRRSGLSFIVDIKVITKNAKLSRDIANQFAKEYLVEQLEGKYQMTQTANEWLERRLKILQKELQEAEAKVEIFRTKAGLLETGGVNGVTLRQQQIADLNTKRLTLNAELIEKRERLRTVERQLSKGEQGISAVLSSRLIQDLRGQKARVGRKLAELSSRYGKKHPELQKANDEISDLNQEINNEILRIVSGMRSELSVARTKVSIIDKDLVRLKSQIGEDNNSLVFLRDLERTAQASRTLYKNFLERFKETSEQQNFQLADARIVSLANISKKASFPNYTMFLLISFLLSCGLSFVVLFFMDMFNNSILYADEIKPLTGTDCIAEIPLLKNCDDLSNYVTEHPFSLYSESIRRLFTNISLNFDKTSKVCAITSSIPNEGKTSTSLSLAKIAATAGKKVLLIDGDMRKRSLTNMLISKNFLGVGFFEYLYELNSLDEVVKTNKYLNFDFIPMKVINEESIDYDYEQLQKCFTKLKNYYDLIIVDCAPIKPVQDTKILLSASDVTFLLVLWSGTDKHIVKSTFSELATVNVKIDAVVLSKVNFEQNKHDSRYGYNDAYYKGYYTTS